ncbi:MAG: VanZ family protein [Mariprofundus sp.]
MLLRTNARRFWLLAFLLLSVVTHAFFIFIDPFETITENLLLNSSFEQGKSNWQSNSSDGVHFDAATGEARLDNADATKTVTIRQYLDRPPGISCFRITVALTTDSVNRGKQAWESARVVFAGLGQNGKRLQFPHVVASNGGTHRLASYSHVFAMPDNLPKLIIIAQLLHATGSMSLHEIAVHGVQVSSTVTCLKWALMLCWGLFLLWSFYFLFRMPRISRMFPMALLVLLAILVGTQISGGIKRSVDHSLIGYVEPYTHMVPYLAGGLPGWEHFLIFSLFSLFTLIGFRHIQLIYVLAAMATIAFITETLQYFAINRTPGIDDFLFDLAGIALGLMFYLLWVLLFKKNR